MQTITRRNWLAALIAGGLGLLFPGVANAATNTKTIATFSDGTVRFEIDYDSNSLYLTALRCINNGTAAAWGQATQVASGRSYDMRFPPGTTYIPIPTSKAERLALTLTPSGKLDGVEYHFVYPYN